MKRKLLCFTVGFALMLLVLQTLTNNFMLFGVFVAAAIGALVCIFVRPIRLVLPILLGILLANLWFSAHEIIWPQNEHIGSEKKNYIVATAQEHSTPAKSGTGVWCRSVVTMINGKEQKTRTSINLFLPNVKTVVTPGDKIEFFGELLPYENSNDFMAFTYYKTRFLDGQAFCDEFRIKYVEEKSIRYLPAIISQKIKEKIDLLFGDTNGIFRAMLTGDRSFISDRQTEQLRITGMSHVIAISGMHVSFLVYFIVLLFGKRRAPYFAIPLILCFGVMIGPLPSVMRALFMQCVILVAPLIKQEADTLTSLAAALLMILLINPYSILDVGLQLSFGATLGLVLYGERANAFITELLPVRSSFLFRVLHPFATTFSASICAMVFTVPITMWTFGTVSLISPIANMLTLWSVSALFITGMIAVLLSFVNLLIGEIVAFPATMLAKFFLGATRTMSEIPYADFSAKDPYMIGIILLFYVLFFILYYLKPRPSQCRIILRLWFVWMGACITVLILSVVLNLSVTASVLDVGQGQSILIQSRSNTVLVDCGSMDRNASEIAYDAIIQKSNRTVDALVLTHLDYDHVSGVERILNRLRVKRLYLYQPLLKSEKASDILRVSEMVGTEIVPVIYWKELDLGDIKLELLPIPKGDERGLAVLVSHEDQDLLITGDVDFEGEKYLLDTYRLPDIEFYVVGHHGSKYSTSKELLTKTKPEVAIISVGASNNYNHPTKEVLNRLSDVNICTKRTDFDGTISVNFQ
ncbi:MAG: DNA internalization-related competence protein ComEC/Rec2 [Ruminococcaceae bacterium]|nr:DNA internalization-related competence protein ComEC/Rec2 [Oscillospiraceae bacterium]